MIEDPCKNCVHQAVCSLENQFASCVKAVATAIVKTPDKSTMLLKDIKFIHVDISCQYYYRVER